MCGRCAFEHTGPSTLPNYLKCTLTHSILLVCRRRFKHFYFSLYFQCIVQGLFWIVRFLVFNSLSPLTVIVHSIFGKIGRSASEETTLQLIQSKCIPALLYGLKACPTNKSDPRSLDFVLYRFFMKLFRTSNVAIVRQCQELFGFQLPSVTLCKRVDRFVGKYYASDNLLCKICSKFV